MAATSLWKRGSKRRVEQIRWKRWEVVHAAILALLMILFSFWLGFWIATHPFD